MGEPNGDESRWDLDYDLKCGEQIVLVRDVDLYTAKESGSMFATFLESHLPNDGPPKKTFKKGTVATVDPSWEPHQSQNGILARVVIEGEKITLCEGDFMPVSLVKQGDGGAK
jgi:hypothetical protein